MQGGRLNTFSFAVSFYFPQSVLLYSYGLGTGIWCEFVMQIQWLDRVFVSILKAVMYRSLKCIIFADFVNVRVENLLNLELYTT
jgi:hypothetical protein